MLNWELYKTDHSGLGTLCEVYLNQKESLIKRIFKQGAITVNGSKTRFSEDEIQKFFTNEIFWLRKLEGHWLPKLIDIDEDSRTIIQEFTDESLLEYKPYLKHKIPDVVEQIVEMYKFFKSKNVFKRNGSLSNLTLRNEQVVAFDFKWATERPNGIDREIYSYDHYLIKVDENLPQLLKDLI